jgi:hypothetical protein
MNPGVMHLVRLVRFVQQDGPLAIDSKVDHGAPLRLLLLPGSSSIAYVGLRGSAPVQFVFPASRRTPLFF